MLGMLWARRQVTALLLQPSPGLETLNHRKIAGNQPLVLKENISRYSCLARPPCGCSTEEAAALPSAAVCSKSKSGACREPAERWVPAGAPASARLLPSQEEVTFEEGKLWPCT